MDGMAMGAPAAPHKMSYTSMTFFWGKNSEILFTGWPGTRSGMYALGLIVTFLLGFLVEWLSYCRLTRSGWSRRSSGLVQTLVHTVRVGLAYLLMLALMSFNVGVLIVAIAGNGFGFLLFRSSLLKHASHSDLPPMKGEDVVDIPTE